MYICVCGRSCRAKKNSKNTCYINPMCIPLFVWSLAFELKNLCTFRVQLNKIFSFQRYIFMIKWIFPFDTKQLNIFSIKKRLFIKYWQGLLIICVDRYIKQKEIVSVKNTAHLILFYVWINLIYGFNHFYYNNMLYRTIF